ncbi:MAG: cob(I)yrinic acid a,c-diamide adenosyltransferase [Epulopiscium sp. Nele67-Bin002]|nr:MAG: cob(I)yrinic acid a,c-diamide adenosyltransferase [Epulopiscium sp. Nuni2H_MBin001]OON91636.1 MAG: cob(I)yrinic acid a,c-diamide adenosyltransferase [Epulopiscium sp. Nele67-Bin002]
MKQGLVEVYCGTGKGKSTAAIGLGIRAIGHGFKVIMIQFLKNDATGEVKLLKSLEPQFKVFHFEKERGFVWTLNDDEIEDLRNEINMAIKFARKVVDTGECDILILDEILGVIENDLIKDTDILELIQNKPEQMELVLTGRKVPETIKNVADYVSEIVDIKHPMHTGAEARKGIEF